MAVDKIILDATCGSRMIWFDKEHPNTVYMDNRQLESILCDGRTLNIHPDVVADFTDMPFEDESFHLVVFDPPPSTEGWERLMAGSKVWVVTR